MKNQKTGAQNTVTPLPGAQYTVTPLPQDKTKWNCDAYMKQEGCLWTHQYTCPGQNNYPNRIGMATNDGSLGYHCCCERGLFNQGGDCNAYMAQTTCSWTSMFSCPGQARGSRGV